MEAPGHVPSLPSPKSGADYSRPTAYGVLDLIHNFKVSLASECASLKKKSLNHRNSKVISSSVLVPSSGVAGIAD